MADFLTIAVAHVLVGFEVYTLGFLNTDFSFDIKHERAIEACLIIAFLCYLVAAVLTILIKTGDLKNKIVNIVTLILAFVAALFIIAGAGRWYDDRNDGEGSTFEYTMTLNMTGAFLAIIGGVFYIVAIIKGGGGGSTSPDPA